MSLINAGVTLQKEACIFDMLMPLFFLGKKRYIIIDYMFLTKELLFAIIYNFYPIISIQQLK